MVSCIMTSGSTITNAGTKENVINTVIIKSGNTDVTNNYNITKVKGILTVSKADCDLAIEAAYSYGGG